MQITVDAGRITVELAAGVRRLNRSLAKVHKDMGLALLTHIQDGFERETAPGGDAWQPLAKSTVSQRGNAHPILQRKGWLSRVYLKSDTSGAIVGSNLAYARIHQFGGEIIRKGGSVRLHFRRVKKGGVRFARAADRRARYGMEATVKPYTIRIPARPYLFNPDGSIPDAWKDSLLRILNNDLGEAHA